MPSKICIFAPKSTWYIDQLPLNVSSAKINIFPKFQKDIHRGLFENTNRNLAQNFWIFMKETLGPLCAGGLNDFSSNKILKQKIASPPVSPQAPPYFFYMGGLLFFQMGGPWGGSKIGWGGSALEPPQAPP